MLASHAKEKLEINFGIDIDASPEAVWDKLGSLEGMNEWFARNLIFEHHVGGRFQMEGEVPGEGPYKFSGEVLRIEPPRELAFTWRSELGEEIDWGENLSVVTFRLEPIETGTRVTLNHTGFEALGSEEGAKAYESHIQGWTMSKTLEGLKDSAEQPI